MDFRDYAKLAVRVYRENTGYINKESRHLFVTLADTAIQKCDTRSICLYHQADLELLLNSVEDATRISLDNGISNCGYYGDNPWIASLTQAACSNSSLYNCIPSSLLRAFQDSLSNRLFTGIVLQEQLIHLASRSACRNSSIAPLAASSLASDASSTLHIGSREASARLAILRGPVLPLSTPPAPNTKPTVSHPCDAIRCDRSSGCRTPLLASPSTEILIDNDSGYVDKNGRGLEHGSEKK